VQLGPAYDTDESHILLQTRHNRRNDRPKIDNIYQRVELVQRGILRLTTHVKNESQMKQAEQSSYLTSQEALSSKVMSADKLEAVGEDILCCQFHSLRLCLPTTHPLSTLAARLRSIRSICGEPRWILRSSPMFCSGSSVT